jgi:hypothetical protein
MWEPRRLTTLWASTACCRDNFTFYFLHDVNFVEKICEGTPYLTESRVFNTISDVAIVVPIFVENGIS